MTLNTFLYFAYGSNMLTRRLTASERAPSAIADGVGFVIGRRLTFHKPSQDGSGKCDAEKTGIETDCVHGVIYKINLKDKPSLDKAEGLGNGYEEENIEVVTSGITIIAKTYSATRKERALRPYHWYKALTLAGAVEHGIPAQYVEWLRTFNSIEDLDLNRRSQNEALLFDI